MKVKEKKTAKPIKILQKRRLQFHQVIHNNVACTEKLHCKLKLHSYARKLIN